MEKKKIIVIVGSTASGKTALAVSLACVFNGEVISADSRQVYRHMDVGTGRDLKEYSVNQKCGKIPYHLIDVVHPNENYDLARWLRDAKLAIADIVKRGKLPIIAGGTGLYAQALVDNFNLSDVGSDEGLRSGLEKKSAEELFAELSLLDKKFAERLNNSDRNNPRRLIRYLELVRHGETVKKRNIDESGYEYLIINLVRPSEDLQNRITKRLLQRIDNEDMIGEVERLNKEENVSWKRLESFGLEYRYIARYLQKKIDYDRMLEKIIIRSRQYAKRQQSWIKRWKKQGANIHFVDSVEKAHELAKEFIT